MTILKRRPSRASTRKARRSCEGSAAITIGERRAVLTAKCTALTFGEKRQMIVCLSLDVQRKSIILPVWLRRKSSVFLALCFQEALKEVREQSPSLVYLCEVKGKRESTCACCLKWKWQSHFL